MALIGEMQYLTIGGNTYSIPISGGSTVSITRSLTSGTKSATISVDGASYDLYAPTPNAGTVTSVRVQATSPVQSSTSTAQSSTLNTTISLANGYGDTKNPYGTKTANYVLAGPSSGSAAAPSFRQLVAADIPDLSGTYLTSSDIADKVDKFNIYRGTEIEDGTYTIDKTKSEIIQAYWDGKYMLFIAEEEDMLYPFLGVDGSTLIFGYSGTYNSTAKLEGYIIYQVNNTVVASKLSDTATIPTRVSELLNDSGFITSYTDTQVTSTAVTAATTNYLVGSTSSSTVTSGLSKHRSADIYTTADSETNGCTRLSLGNTTATFAAGGKEGQIRLYGTSANYCLDLKPGAIEHSNKTITFPNATGTVALTSDIPQVYSSTNTGGYLTMATLPIYDGGVS